MAEVEAVELHFAVLLPQNLVVVGAGAAVEAVRETHY